jgi:hypothetical protein
VLGRHRLPRHRGQVPRTRGDPQPRARRRAATPRAGPQESAKARSRKTPTGPQRTPGGHDPTAAFDSIFAINFIGAGLVAHFARYLRRPEIDLVRDGVGYRSVVMNLSDEEFEAMGRDLNAALRPYLGREARPPRRPRLLATVALPLEDEVEPDRPAGE